MPDYQNLGGNSNVASYEIGPDSISVLFNDGNEYVYTNKSAGASSINRMKELAEAGRGLNSYIMRFVKYGFESRSRSGPSQRSRYW